MTQSSDSPGWDAIDAALHRLYPTTVAQHFGSVPHRRFGGPPLDGVSFYRRDEPLPHWHIVSYGMSDLFVKETDDPTVSGWGFEFTFRPARASGDDQPPMLAADLLNYLAGYVIESGNVLDDGHHMDLRGPLDASHPTGPTALLFRTDPELGVIETPHGSVRFLQIVGVTTDEYAAAVRWHPDRLLDLLEEHLPLLVTDLGRRSVLTDPAVLDRIDAGIRADGSATDSVLTPSMRWAGDPTTGIRLSLRATAVGHLRSVLRARLPHGRPLVVGAGGGVRFVPGDDFTMAVPTPGWAEVRLPGPAIEALDSALAAGPGVHPVAGTAVTIEVT